MRILSQLPTSHRNDQPCADRSTQQVRQAGLQNIVTPSGGSGVNGVNYQFPNMSIYCERLIANQLPLGDFSDCCCLPLVFLPYVLAREDIFDDKAELAQGRGTEGES